MEQKEGIFNRTELLLGKEFMQRITQARVIVFGVGGVGSWCAESLTRSGVGHLTIVDSDKVAASNVNRQLMATTRTIGEVKVEVLKKRLLEINPDAEIVAIEQVYNAENSDSYNLSSFDYVVDAIDSLEHKIHLIRTVTKTKAKLFSSMGAALKCDSSRIQTAEFWKVKGCPLAAAIRRKIKKGERPSKKFTCVFSDEVIPNKGAEYSEEVANHRLQQENKKNEAYDPNNSDWNSKKAQINGTLSHITAIFGFTLAGLIVNDIRKQIES